MRISCGRVSCDFTFYCIPVAHENRAIVSRLSLPRAGDVIIIYIQRSGIGGSGNETKGRKMYTACLCTIMTALYRVFFAVSVK